MQLDSFLIFVLLLTAVTPPRKRLMEREEKFWLSRGDGGQIFCNKIWLRETTNRRPKDDTQQSANPAIQHLLRLKLAYARFCLVSDLGLNSRRDSRTSILLLFRVQSRHFSSSTVAEGRRGLLELKRWILKCTNVRSTYDSYLDFSSETLAPILCTSVKNEKP